MNVRRKLEQFIDTPPSEADCPTPDMLAAYILGQLDGTDELSVAAHVRGCPLCQLDQTLFTIEPEPRPTRLSILNAILRPPSPAAGLRSGGVEPNSVQYTAGNLIISLSTMQQSASSWQLRGSVLSNGQGLPDWIVTVSVPGRRYRQISNESGFFVFDRLPTGRCQISLRNNDLRIRIRNLMIGDTETQ